MLIQYKEKGMPSALPCGGGRCTTGSQEGANCRDGTPRGSPECHGVPSRFRDSRGAIRSEENGAEKSLERLGSRKAVSVQVGQWEPSGGGRPEEGGWNVGGQGSETASMLLDSSVSWISSIGSTKALTGSPEKKLFILRWKMIFLKWGPPAVSLERRVDTRPSGQ